MFFFFVPLFRGRQLTRRPYGHFAAFLCFRKLFFTYIGVFFVLISGFDFNTHFINVKLALNIFNATEIDLPLLT